MQTIGESLAVYNSKSPSKTEKVLNTQMLIIIMLLRIILNSSCVRFTVKGEDSMANIVELAVYAMRITFSNSRIYVFRFADGGLA